MHRRNSPTKHVSSKFLTFFINLHTHIIILQVLEGHSCLWTHETGSHKQSVLFCDVLWGKELKRPEFGGLCTDGQQPRSGSRAYRQPNQQHKRCLKCLTCNAYAPLSTSTENYISLFPETSLPAHPVQQPQIHHFSNCPQHTLYVFTYLISHLIINCLKFSLYCIAHV